MCVKGLVVRILHNYEVVGATTVAPSFFADFLFALSFSRWFFILLKHD